MESFTALSHRAQVSRLKRLAEAALAEYDLPGARLAPLAHAFNTTFKVTDAEDNRYALRVTRPGKSTVAEAQSELAWLVALHRDTDLVVPDPVPTGARALLTVAAAPGVPEPRICALFRWVPGRFVRAGLMPHHMEQIGRLTARLQDHAQGFQPPPGFTRPRIDDIATTRAAVVPLVAGVRTAAHPKFGLGHRPERRRIRARSLATDRHNRARPATDLLGTLMRRTQSPASIIAETSSAPQ